MPTGRRISRIATIAGAAIAMMAASAREARAHCDTIDGPVVSAARTTLENGSLAGVLIWVRQQDEQEITRAFQHARSVRNLGAEARDLADLYFFETVVRVHRSSEGEPYTGLKPAASNAGSPILMADRALASANVTELETLLTEHLQEGLHARFEQTVKAQTFARGDVASGRAFVAAYVDLMHYVESVHALGAGGSHETVGHVKR